MNVRIIGLKTLAMLDQLALADTYQQVYGAAPWSEWKKCSNPECQKHWGIEQKTELENENFRHCDLEVQDYWPIQGEDGLLQMFKNLSGSQLFRASVAFDVDTKKMVGFCWGHKLELPELNEKFELPEVQTLVSVKISDEKPLIYLSDIAVDLTYRGGGVAQKLIRQFLRDNQDNGWMITRTKGGDDPSVTNAWFYRLGFELLLPYNDGRGRELQFAKMNSLLK
jgi:ribosomal protein S18 acetylase RimI-like enzyme